MERRKTILRQKNGNKTTLLEVKPYSLDGLWIRTMWDNQNDIFWIRLAGPTLEKYDVPFYRLTDQNTVARELYVWPSEDFANRRQPSEGPAHVLFLFSNGLKHDLIDNHELLSQIKRTDHFRKYWISDKVSVTESLSAKGELRYRYFKDESNYTTFRKESFDGGKLIRSVMKQPLANLGTNSLPQKWQKIFTEVAKKQKLEKKARLLAVVFDHTSNEASPTLIALGYDKIVKDKNGDLEKILTLKSVNEPSKKSENWNSESDFFEHFGFDSEIESTLGIGSTPDRID